MIMRPASAAIKTGRRGLCGAVAPLIHDLLHGAKGSMKELAPLEMLVGTWSGKGKGSYGPFTMKVEVERRGRWLLMCQEIKVPVVHITTYVSTQVYGFDAQGLTLDYFDTAGAFRFHGAPGGDGKADALHFEWRDGSNRKTSRYWKEGETVRFAYESSVRDEGSDDIKHETYEGTLERARKD
jgi:hypothetical protein